MQERDSYKYKLWRLVESTPFEYFIMTLIVLNTILLMLKVKPISSTFKPEIANVTSISSDNEVLSDIHTFRSE